MLVQEPRKKDLYKMKILINAGRLCLNALYFFLRQRPVRNRVCMLSRESDGVPLDFLLLEKELHRTDSDIEVKYVCELLDTKRSVSIKLLINTLKCMNVLSTSKACVVDTYNIPVSILRHRKELTVAQIWHALGAVKKFGYQSLDSEGGRSSSFAALLSMHKNYSFITCASEATKEFYAEAFQAKPEKVLVLGMPRLDYITHGEGKKYAKETLYKKYSQLQNKINILYAPTFRENESADFNTIINTIDVNKYNLIIKSHILSKDKPYKNLEGVIFSDDSVFDLFTVSDYVITDYSAVSFEAAAAGGKLFFYVYDIDEYERSRGLNINPLSEYPEISSKDFKDIYGVIESGEYPVQEVEKFKNKYIETGDGKCCERIAKALLNM